MTPLFIAHEAQVWRTDIEGKPLMVVDDPRAALKRWIIRSETATGQNADAVAAVVVHLAGVLADAALQRAEQSQHHGERV